MGGLRSRCNLLGHKGELNMEKIYTVKTYDKGTDTRTSSTFKTYEAALKYIDIYAKLGFEVFLETRERKAGEC